MQKFLCSVFVALVLVFGSVAVTLAETPITIDLGKLSPEDAAKVLAAQKTIDSAVVAIPTTEKAKEWIGLGREIGMVIASVCKELSIGVNEFVATPVGKLTMYMVVWKVVGKDIWHIVGGLGMWVLVTSILLWSYRFFHMTIKVKNGKEGEVKYVKRFEFESKDAKSTSAAAHAVIFIVMTGICMIIIF